jgi:hypothetical protein
MSERTVRDRDSDRHRHYDRAHERRRERSSSPRRSSQHHSGHRRDHGQPIQMPMQMQPMMSHPALPLNANAQPYMPLNMPLNMPNMPNMTQMSNMNMPMVNMAFPQQSMHQPPRAHRTFRADAPSSLGNTQCTNTVLVRNLPEELLNRRALYPVFGKYGRIAQLNLIIPKQQVFVFSPPKISPSRTLIFQSSICSFRYLSSMRMHNPLPRWLRRPLLWRPILKFKVRPHHFLDVAQTFVHSLILCTAMMARYELEAQVELPPEPKTPLLSEEALNKLRVTLSEKQLEKQNIEGQIAHQKTLQEKINASAKLPAEDKIKMISKVNTVIGCVSKIFPSLTIKTFLSDVFSYVLRWIEQDIADCD